MTKLFNVDVRIEDENKVIMLLSFLPKSYGTLATTLLVANFTLMVNDVLTALLETTNSKKSTDSLNGKKDLCSQSQTRCEMLLLSQKWTY